jgi:hypothetical protein
MRITRTATAVLSPIALLAALTACDGGSTPAPSATKPAAAGTAALPAGLVTRGAVEGPGVGAAKATAKVGQPITVVGRIGGSENPYVAGRAVFTIVDPSLKSCADAGDDDHCTTPWDYCCESRESLKKNVATIEIAGADGRPLPIAVRGIEGLDPLATIAVTGTVTEANDAGLLVIRATRIAVK